jgi:hypothetical protein
VTEHLVRISEQWSLWRLASLRSSGMPLDWLSGFADPTDSDADAQSAAVGRLLGEPRFMTALAWQNPSVVRAWADKHARALACGKPLRRGGTRQAVLARYAQRYCAKNDTIGFFGPVAWARFDETAMGLRQVGAGGIRSRSVHFETWAVEALAASWCDDEFVAPHLPVRINPAVSFDGRLVRRPWRAEEEITPLAAAVLRAAQRVRRAGAVSELAAELSGHSSAEAAAKLRELYDSKLVIVGFVVPLNESPEASLREQVEHIEDDQVRSRLLLRLEEFDVLRARVAAAGGDPVAVHSALEDLNEVFVAAVSREATRGKDESQHGRAVLYEDCRRDIDVVLGGDQLDALGTPLHLVLDTASWLARETATAVSEQLLDHYQALRGRVDDVRLSELYFSAADTLSGAPGTVVHEVVADFRARWAELLASGTAGDGPDEIRLSSERLAKLVPILFPPGVPLWSGARYHSPDVMLARSDRATRWILGELHVALNTLENRFFHTQADDRDELAAAVAADMIVPRVISLRPNSSRDVSPRTYPPLTVHLPDRYVYWSAAEDCVAPPGAKTWPATALKVRQVTNDLVVEAPGGAWTAPLLEVLGEFLSALVVNRFELRDAAPELPRVVLDNLVICRRSWRIPAADLPSDVGGLELLAARLRALGVPRRTFVRTPIERKPFFVDLDAPLLLRNMARALRHTKELPSDTAFVHLTEMSPDAGEMWLVDSAGDHYTSEFRLVAVDHLTAVGAALHGHARPGH